MNRLCLLFGIVGACSAFEPLLRGTVNHASSINDSAVSMVLHDGNEMPVATRRLMEMPAAYAENMSEANVSNLTREVANLTREVVKFKTEAFYLVDNIVDFVEDKVDFVKDKVDQTVELGKAVAKVVNILISSARPLIEAVWTAAETCWEMMQNIKERLVKVYDKFKPAEADFDRGIVGLLAIYVSEEKMGALIDTVSELLTIVDPLGKLADEMSKIAHILGQIKDSINQLFAALDKITDSGSGFEDLLKGLDFMSKIDFFIKVSEDSVKLITDLEFVHAVFTPLFQKMTGEVQGNHGSQDKEEYEKAIKLIVPSWQKLESAVIDVACPKLWDAVEDTQVFLCRINRFISKAVDSDVWWKLHKVPQLMLTIRNECEAETADVTAVRQCPTGSRSAEIKDTISKHAGLLGTIAAVSSCNMLNISCLLDVAGTVNRAGYSLFVTMLIVVVSLSWSTD